MKDWDRRRMAILAAKDSPAFRDGFVLVRTLPIEGEACFWRGLAPGTRIAKNEQTIALYERAEDAAIGGEPFTVWIVRKPYGCNEEAQKVVAVLVAAELKSRRRAGAVAMVDAKRKAAGKWTPTTTA